MVVQANHGLVEQYNETFQGMLAKYMSTPVVKKNEGC